MISFLIISDDDLPRIICSNEWPLYNQHVRPGPHSKFKILIKNRPVRENHILSKFWFRQKLLFFWLKNDYFNLMLWKWII